MENWRKTVQTFKSLFYIVQAETKMNDACTSPTSTTRAVENSGFEGFAFVLNRYA